MKWRVMKGSGRWGGRVGPSHPKITSTVSPHPQWRIILITLNRHSLAGLGEQRSSELSSGEGGVFADPKSGVPQPGTPPSPQAWPGSFVHSQPIAPGPVPVTPTPSSPELSVQAQPPLSGSIKGGVSASQGWVTLRY